MNSDNETPVDDYCHAWEGDYSDIPQVEPKSYDQFYIQFHIEFTYLMAIYEEEGEEDDDEPDYLSHRMQSMRITFCHQFWERCERLSQNNLAWDTIHRMLSRLQVPTHKQPFMIQKISACADEIANRVSNRARKVLPMIVSIGVIVDNTQEATRESMEAELRTNPASKEAVETLEKVKVEDCERATSHCMICLQKFEDGVEATRMPCLHIYHGNCIVSWLQVSNFCPLCRFQLPH